MKTEKLYKTAVVDAANLEEGETPFCLDYFVVESDVQLSASGFDALFYGVSVVKRTMDGQHMEHACQTDMFVSESDCKAFLDLLARNTVTPATLEDVVKDWRGSLVQYSLSLGA